MKYILSLLLFLASTFSFSQGPVVLTQRDQARVIDELLEDDPLKILDAIKNSRLIM